MHVPFFSPLFALPFPPFLSPQGRRVVKKREKGGGPLLLFFFFFFRLVSVRRQDLGPRSGLLLFSSFPSFEANRAGQRSKRRQGTVPPLSPPPFSPFFLPLFRQQGHTASKERKGFFPPPSFPPSFLSVFSTAGSALKGQRPDQFFFFLFSPPPFLGAGRAGKIKEQKSPGLFSFSFFFFSFLFPARTHVLVGLGPSLLLSPLLSFFFFLSRSSPRDGPSPDGPFSSPLSLFLRRRPARSVSLLLFSSFFFGGTQCRKENGNAHSLYSFFFPLLSPVVGDAQERGKRLMVLPPFFLLIPPEQGRVEVEGKGR